MTFYSDMFSLVFDSRFSINDLKSVLHCVIDNQLVIGPRAVRIRGNRARYFESDSRYTLG